MSARRFGRGSSTAGRAQGLGLREDDDSDRSTNQIRNSMMSGYEGPSKPKEMDDGDEVESEARALMLERVKRDDALDVQFGFPRLSSETMPEPKTAWLINMHPTAMEEGDGKKLRSALDLYFMEPDGSTFKVTKPMFPYFYLAVKDNHLREVEGFLRRRFDKLIEEITPTDRVDLEMKNHLSGIQKPYLKVEFSTVQDLVAVKAQIFPIVAENRARLETTDAYEENDNKEEGDERRNYAEYIEDIREYDIPYYVRCSIDMDIRVANWYTLSFKTGNVLELEHEKELQHRPSPKVLAFDIETTKLPLKFPDASIDQVMMISYMLDGQGYLITNREIVGEDIDHFEYTPLPDFKGPFHVFNEANEKATIERFVEHIKEIRPNIFVTYNGDTFDWMFLNERSKILRIPLSRSIGLRYDNANECYLIRWAPHLDCLRWVIRDSYLPQGSHGLKAVTKNKLRYNPLEVDPEKMLEYARERPQEMAAYSVSDAVATYYLYMQYVHPFIFSLCTILPLDPDDVLRKGTGTLCESLLMIEAFERKIIFPNKSKTKFDNYYDGHLIESETYVGGHVEALQTGVYRKDIPIKFKVDRETIQSLIDTVDSTLKFAIEMEENEDDNFTVADCVNYDDVKDQIVKSLTSFIERPAEFEVEPRIYHVDVAAMYPNIILTNRLQPVSIVNDTICSSCIFNDPENRCKRDMEWEWRVDYFPASRGDITRLRNQLETEVVTHKDRDGNEVSSRYFQLPQAEKNNALKERIKKYCRTSYKKVKETANVVRKDTVCMRENPFYVDTVERFRNRRMEHKRAAGDAQKKRNEATNNGDLAAATEAAAAYIVSDSLQLAHKCILNSFYGYVMRKAARWYSMEMAGIVTYTGANIIKRSRELIEKIGMPLELDTDGIWCCLPAGLPEILQLKFKNGRSRRFNYVCSTLNVRVHREFTNTQYQNLQEGSESMEYSIADRCTIYFEVDGPWRAMVLPSSEHEGKQLKKRYVVFKDNGTIQELKGFEIKRRGELKLIKEFQSQIFGAFLAGDNLKESYAAAAAVADHYLDILDTKGESMDDGELLAMISESRNMSKSLDEYGAQRSAAITTAKRLSEFLDNSSVRGAGVSCRFVIAKKPETASVSDRAIPADLFAAPPAVQQRFVRKWCSDNGLVDCSFRAIVDWDYYRQRLTNQILKLICLPSYFQGLQNPVPRVAYPDWLLRRMKSTKDAGVQMNLQSLFASIREKNQLDGADSSLGLGDNNEVMEAVGDENNNQSESNITGDIEDIVVTKTVTQSSPKKKSGKITSMLVKRSRETYEEGATETIEDVLGKAPDEKTDPKGWLAWQKNKWRIQREQRKRRKAELGENAHLQRALTSQKATGLQSFLNKKNLSLLYKQWQILQVSETGDAGVLRLWVLTDDDALHDVRLQVGRRFFVNTFQENTEHGRSVRLNLPRNRQRFHLYEWEIPEENYMGMKQVIEMQKSSPDVEGLYESQVPLWFRAIVELGCVCSVRPSSRSHSVQQNWELKHLQFIGDNTGPIGKKSPPPNYLPGSSLRYVFLYQSGSGQRAVFATHFPNQKRIVVIYAAAVNQEDVRSFIEQTLATTEIGEVTVEQIREPTIQRAAARVQSTLDTYRAQNTSAFIMLAQCGLTPMHELKRMIPFVDSLPVMVVATNENDNAYTPFGWMQFAANRLIGRIKGSAKLAVLATNLARYSRVPLCNFELDFSIFLADIQYARALKGNDFVMWYSETGKPDLGGNDEDDSIFAVNVPNPEKCLPDCIDTISIEMRIIDLFADAVAQVAHIPDLDGGLVDLQSAESEALAAERNPSMINFNSFDETATCAKAFRVLRHLLVNWLADTQDPTREQQANFFADRFQRWISAPRSRLFDPALNKLVHKLAKKVWQQLLAELKKLGARVVYATFEKVIIATDKRTYAEAQTYFEFIAKTIRQNRDMFKFIHFQKVRFYEVLLFKDPSNFVGVEALLEPVEPSELVNLAQRQDEEGNALHVGIQMAEFLPLTLQNSLAAVVLVFIQRVLEQKRKIDRMPLAEQTALRQRRLNEETKQVDTNGRVQDDDVMDDLIAEWHRGDREMTATEVSAASVTSEFDDSELMRMITTKLLDEHNPVQAMAREDSVFGRKNFRRGAATTEAVLEGDIDGVLEHLVHPSFDLENPVLEYIKIVCYLFSLRKGIASRMQNLKRSLLRQVNIREFSEQAKFSDPAMTYILPNVFCSFCTAVRNLDLLRDPELRGKKWNCTMCHSSLNKSAIEARLVEIVQRRSAHYQTQDLVCRKCEQVKADYLATICTNCSSSFRTKEGSEEVFNELLVFVNIAKFHKMSWLADTIEWILQLRPGTVLDAINWAPSPTPTPTSSTTSPSSFRPSGAPPSAEAQLTPLPHWG